MTTFRRAALVFAGGVLGSAARLGVGLVIPSDLLATMIVNVLGSFLLGALAARVSQGTPVRDAIGTGALGGFTTYSAFAVQIAQGELPLTVLYALASIVLGLTAAVLGMRCGTRRVSS